MEKYNWSEFKLTSDGQFACRYCQGSKQKAMPIGSDNMTTCWMCDGSGYMIDVIVRDLKYAKSHHEDTKKELKELREWIRSTSTCSKCGGNEGKTLGGHKCNECGLEGRMPWGG